MCGYFFSLTSSPLNNSQEDAVYKSLKNRGPDDFGVFRTEVVIDKNKYYLTFLHTRLSIIDLSKAGHQPMMDVHSRYILIYNGEIYNYAELKNKLKLDGVHFVSQTDSEVLLQSYIYYGEKILEELRGMFSFVIWDREKKHLFFARDHLGIKPLYYGYSYEKNDHFGEDFFISSEISALLSLDLFNGHHISQDGLKEYLTLGHCLSPHTIIENIYSLQPGFKGTMANGPKTLELKSYFHLNSLFNIKESSFSKMSFDEVKKDIKKTLIETVRRHMIADVPIGMMLSGGIDSSVLACLMSKEMRDVNLHTWTLGFEDKYGSFDERKISRKISEKIKSHHSEVIVTEENFKDNFEEFIEAIDVPSVDGLNTFFITKTIGKNQKIVISGMGSDEFFAGYPIFQKYNQYLKRLKNSKVTGTYPFLKLVIPDSVLGNRVLRKLRLENLYLYSHDILDFYQLFRVLEPLSFMKQVFTPHLEKLERKNNLNDISLYEQRFYLSPLLLRDADVTSMHHSLELRVPFIDIDLISKIYSLPDEWKISTCGKGKWILREIFKDDLIPEIFQEPKRGFELPIGFWLKKNFEKKIFNLPESLREKGIIHPRLHEIIKKWLHHPSSYQGVWKYLVLDEWLNKWNKKMKEDFIVQ